MKISVIVPIYNMEKFIFQTISCLKNQDESNLEFLLVNDGSTDSTLSLMQELCAGDSRFHIFTTANKGYGHACNFGIRQATGEFFAIFEPDDHITNDFYSNLRQIAEHYRQADVIRYNGIFRQENGVSRKLYHWETKFTERIIDKYDLKRFWRSHPSVFNGIYRKNFILQKSVFFCETPGASFQDAMFMVSLFYSNPSIYIINNTKYTYNIHNMQSTNFVDNKISFVIDSWYLEADWLEENCFLDCDFLLYKAFTQMNSIIKKSSRENKKCLIANFKLLSKGNRFLKSDIATLKTKIQFYLYSFCFMWSCK